jgi:hypothetical protein
MPLGRSVVGLPLLFACLLTTSANPLTKHTQKGTFLQTSNSVFVTCPSNCTAVKALFPVAKIVCPALATQSCTYYVHLETASTTVVFGGLFKFLVDGAAPTPGPTDSSGFVTFSFGPDEETHAFSYAVVGKVTNSVDNQSHTVEVDLGCTSDSLDPCQAGPGAATLRIDVFQP